jgi:hypothetical protein
MYEDRAATLAHRLQSVRSSRKCRAASGTDLRVSPDGDVSPMAIEKENKHHEEIPWEESKGLHAH